MLKLNLAVSSYWYRLYSNDDKIKVFIIIIRFKIFCYYDNKYQINRRLLRNFMIKIAKIKAFFYIVQINRRR